MSAANYFFSKKKNNESNTKVEADVEEVAPSSTPNPNPNPNPSSNSSAENKPAVQKLSHLLGLRGGKPSPNNTNNNTSSNKCAGGGNDSSPLSSSETKEEKKTTSSDIPRTFHVAIQGCSHGALTDIYEQCAAHERQTKQRIDLLLCCGDFQAIRCQRDLDSMAVPQKYRELGDFPLYYSGQKKAPYLTLFVGGNHENSDWLAEESYGGFLCENIYYVGHSGVVVVDGGLCIAGLSGIFKDRDYDAAYPPRPFSRNESAKREAYHVRRLEVEKLRLFSTLSQLAQECVALNEETRNNNNNNSGISGNSSVLAPFNEVGSQLQHSLSLLPIHIAMSHDWPVGITKYGDEDQLLRFKPYFREDINNNDLGNPHTLPLLRAIRPQYWFAAHLHCYFQAIVPHYSAKKALLPELERGMEGEGIGKGGNSGAAGSESFTTFMALDKCLGKRHHVEFLDIPVTSTGSHQSLSSQQNHRIQPHPLWIQVLRVSHGFLLPQDSSNNNNNNRSRSHNSTGRNVIRYSERDLSVLLQLQSDSNALRQLLSHAALGGTLSSAQQQRSQSQSPPQCTKEMLKLLGVIAAPLQLTQLEQQQQQQHYQQNFSPPFNNNNNNNNSGGGGGGWIPNESRMNTYSNPDPYNNNNNNNSNSNWKRSRVESHGVDMRFHSVNSGGGGGWSDRTVVYGYNTPSNTSSYHQSSMPHMPHMPPPINNAGGGSGGSKGGEDEDDVSTDMWTEDVSGS